MDNDLFAELNIALNKGDCDREKWPLTPACGKGEAVCLSKLSKLSKKMLRPESGRGGRVNQDGSAVLVG